MTYTFYLLLSSAILDWYDSLVGLLVLRQSSGKILDLLFFIEVSDWHDSLMELSCLMQSPMIDIELMFSSLI